MEIREGVWCHIVSGEEEVSTVEPDVWREHPFAEVAQAGTQRVEEVDPLGCAAPHVSILELEGHSVKVSHVHVMDTCEWEVLLDADTASPVASGSSSCFGSRPPGLFPSPDGGAVANVIETAGDHGCDRFSAGIVTLP